MVNNDSHSSENQNSPNSVFESSATYCMALSQLESVASLLKIDRGILQRLSVPKRAMIVSVPVRMDDGATRVFNGYRVQHSLTSGPSKGGLRYHQSVDLGEVAALSMWMSWKCGIMNLPFGGAKGGITCDPESLSLGEKERLTRRFTEELLSIIGPRMDVMAPDMGTDEQTMAWIMDTYSMKVGYACPEIVTGKPVELGGCLGRREATGRGVTFCILEALKDLNIKPEEATAVVQGFGNVGAITCAELSQKGIKVIAVSDRYGAIHNPDGINITDLQNFVSNGNLLKDFPKANLINPNEMLVLPCTVLVPAALERVINLKNASQLKCKILAEAANGPTTPEADAIINESDIYVIPDILCNAGGVTVSYFEWVQDIQQLLWSEEQVNHKLYELMIKAFRRVRDLALTKKISMRLAALSLGVEKIAREKMRRGLFP
jgi:glutamate dehydrogenase (NAD(P)+)